MAARQLVCVACDASRAAGVAPGMTLAEARALCPGLTAAESRPDHDRQGLERLARWMVRFSPVVAVEPPDALAVDVTGSERLFGGLDRLARLTSDALTRLGLRHGLAIAPTLGAAWAMATHHGKTCPILSADQITPALAPLPVSALRLDEATVRAFATLGIETIGQLVELPRNALPSRFGSTVLARVDQAFGRQLEPLVAVSHARPIRAALKFDGGVHSLTHLWVPLQGLLDEVLEDLRVRGCGARELHVDFLQAGLAPVRQTIRLSRPSCDARSLWNLLRCASETVRCGRDGFNGLQLSVPLFDRVSVEQLQLIAHDESSAASARAEVDHLIARLQVRLGPVRFPVPVAAHLPEQAFRYADAPPPPVRNPIVPPVRSRPLRLLPTPVEVRCTVWNDPPDAGRPTAFTHEGRVQHLAHCDGPERIAGPWWEGRHKTRDYFDVEDQAGRRYWIFRVLETRKWYLHGAF